MNEAVERVLSLLDKVKRTKKDQWTACCPGHDDRKPSLSIGVGDDGEVLLFCHAGCPAENVVARMGLKMSDLFPNGEARHRRKAKTVSSKRGGQSVRRYPTRTEAIRAAAKSAGGRPVMGWRYDGSDGKELFWVVRFETADDKEFRPIARDGDGWRIGDPPGPLPLYRLKELDGNAPVYVPEGEKAADAAWDIGLTATTSAHGAQAPAKTDWTPLAGREVVILPDNDDQGRGYARKVADILWRLDPPARVLIVDLPGLPPKGDIVEFIEARQGQSPEEVKGEIKRLVEEARPIDPSEVRGGPVLIRMADVKPEKVSWLWPGRVPRGKLTLLAGDPGLGKSLMTLDITARLTTGRGWPDGAEAAIEACPVIMLSAEDGIGDTIRPRLDAAGADVTKVYVLLAVTEVEHRSGTPKTRMFSLEDDLAELERAICRIRDVRLVVIDPISAYLGGTDSHKNSDIRGLLAPLAEVAARHRVAVLAVTHLNKNAQGSPMYRAMGSLAFVAAARSYWMVTEDKGNPSRRLLRPIKSNLSSVTTALAYSTVGSPEDPEVPVIAWEPDPVQVSADEAMVPVAGSEEDRTALQDAVEWLEEALADGPVAPEDLQRMAKENGYAWATVRRAKVKLRVRSVHEGFGKGSKWYWALPDHRCPNDPGGAQPQSMSIYDKDEHLWGSSERSEESRSPASTGLPAGEGDSHSADTPQHRCSKESIGAQVKGTGTYAKDEHLGTPSPVNTEAVFQKAGADGGDSAKADMSPERLLSPWRETWAHEVETTMHDGRLSREEAEDRAMKKVLKLMRRQGAA